MKLRHHETGATWAPYNLALEEALADSLTPDSPGLFLLWQNRPSVIIGRHQDAHSEVDLAELRGRGYDLVRRLTGGGAVYHDLGNLNFSFILPREAPEGQLLAPLMTYLRGLGLEVVREGRNDLSLAGMGKFSGLASRRWPGGWQLHGTIMHEVNLDALEGVLRVDPEKYRRKGVASVRARVANLRSRVDLDMAALWAGIRAAYGVSLSPLPEDVENKARALAETKYGRDYWNLGLFPPDDLVRRRRFSFGSLELRLAVQNGRITAARLTGDFFTSARAEEPMAPLEAALISLPANDPQAWAEAWRAFDLSQFFAGQTVGDEVRRWLAEEGGEG